MDIYMFPLEAMYTIFALPACPHLRVFPRDSQELLQLVVLVGDVEGIVVSAVLLSVEHLDLSVTLLPQPLRSPGAAARSSATPSSRRLPS